MSRVQTKIGECYYSDNELDHLGETDLMIDDDCVVGIIYIDEDDDDKIKIEIFDEIDED